MEYQRARQFFEAARAANSDIERCRRQLERAEDMAARVSSPCAREWVRATRDVDAMGGRVAAMVDREAALYRRLEADYAMIDAACAVLYGTGGARGLDAVAPSPAHADVLWHRYAAGGTWEAAAYALMRTTRTARRVAAEALEIVDARGLLALAEPLTPPEWGGTRP